MSAPKCCCPSRDSGECILIRYPIRDAREDEHEECECSCHAECLFNDCQWEDQP